MNKWLKRILLGVAGILVVLIVAVLTLPFLIDPNTFKGPLERAAASQNMELRLEGPIDWQFYPRLGLSLEGVYIAPLAQANQPLARAESGTAAVALLPLFSGQVLVDALVLKGLALNLEVDEQGRGNWELLGPQDTTTQEPQEEASTAGGTGFELAVDRILLEDAAITYLDRQSGQELRLSGLTAQMTDVNLESRGFPLTIDGTVQLPDLPNPLQLHLEGTLQANQALDQFAAGDLRFSVQAADQSLTADAAVQVSLAPLLTYQGRIAVQPFNPRALLQALGQTLPDTSDPEVLSSAAMELTFKGNETNFASEALSFNLDGTRFTGQLGLDLPAGGIPTVNLQLQGNQLVVDRYLAPEPEGEEAPAAGKAQAPASAGLASTEATPLPLESLRSVNADLALAMEEIVVMEMPVRNPRLALSGANGLWSLKDLSADFYQGKLQGQAELDARPSRGDRASLKAEFAMDGLAVEPLLTDFAEFSDLSGIVDGNFKAETEAATDQQLVENLAAAFAFTSPALVFQGVNAEYFYCQMASQVGDGKMPKREWPPRTQITAVEGQLTFDNQRLNIASFVANVENLVLTASGVFNLEEMLYQIRVPMRIAQQQSSASGCLVESKFLRDRAVDVLGCAGSLAELDFGEQCGLDKAAVTTLAKQAVRYNVDKQVTEEKQEIREELKEKVREKLGGEEEADTARQLLRDLLRR